MLQLHHINNSNFLSWTNFFISLLLALDDVDRPSCKSLRISRSYSNSNIFEWPLQFQGFIVGMNDMKWIMYMKKVIHDRDQTGTTSDSRLVSIISHSKQDREATPLLLIHLSYLSSSVSPTAKLSIIMTPAWEHRDPEAGSLHNICGSCWAAFLPWDATIELLSRSGPLWGDCKRAKDEILMLVHTHTYTPRNNTKIFPVLHDGRLVWNTTCLKKRKNNNITVIKSDNMNIFDHFMYFFFF